MTRGSKLVSTYGERCTTFSWHKLIGPVHTHGFEHLCLRRPPCHNGRASTGIGPSLAVSRSNGCCSRRIVSSSGRPRAGARHGDNRPSQWRTYLSEGLGTLPTKYELMFRKVNLSFLKGNGSGESESMGGRSQYTAVFHRFMECIVFIQANTILPARVQLLIFCPQSWLIKRITSRLSQGHRGVVATGVSKMQKIFWIGLSVPECWSGCLPSNVPNIPQSSSDKNHHLIKVSLKI